MKVSELLADFQPVSDATPLGWCRCDCFSCGSDTTTKERVEKIGLNRCNHCESGHSVSTIRHSTISESRYEYYCCSCDEGIDHEWNSVYSCNDDYYCDSCWQDDSCYADGGCPEHDMCGDCYDQVDSPECTCCTGDDCDNC